jgi:hypothetical protein
MFMKKLLLGLSMFCSISSFAGAPNLTNIDETELQGILSDFSSNMVHSTATGASSLGKILGFEFGVVASSIEAPKIKAVDSSTDKLANASVYANISIPIGIGAEALLTPVDVGGLEYKYQSVAFYWSFGSLMGLPFDMKLKAAKTSAELSYTDSNSAPNTQVRYEHDGTNLTFSVSKSFLVIEPYLGVGRASGDNKLTADATLFSGSAQTIAQAGVEKSDTYFFAGVDLNLLLVRIGAEYSNPFDNKKMALRLAFGF